jgi:hypothetical protein
VPMASFLSGAVTACMTLTVNIVTVKSLSLGLGRRFHNGCEKLKPEPRGLWAVVFTYIHSSLNLSTKLTETQCQALYY